MGGGVDESRVPRKLIQGKKFKNTLMFVKFNDHIRYHAT